MINKLLRLLGLPRRLTAQELTEIQELTRIAVAERFKAHHFAENTAMLTVDKGHRGQFLALQQQRVAELCEQLKTQHVNAKLAELGYTHEQKVTIDLHTGRITVINN